MKKGFTLIELLVVIVVIGAIATLVLPGLVENYLKSLDKIMITEENLINDAATLAIKDYCNSPVNASKRQDCLSDGTKGLIREAEIEGQTKYYVCINDLRKYGYYDNDLVYEKTSCYGFTTFEKSEYNKFINAKTYVFCGEYVDDLDYVTDKNVYYEDYGCEE